MINVRICWRVVKSHNKSTDVVKNEDRRLAIELGLIAVIFSMGIASMISATNTRMHLDIFEWSNNMTALEPEIIEEFQEKEEFIIHELIFGWVFIVGGLLGLIKLFFKYRKKSNASQEST